MRALLFLLLSFLLPAQEVRVTSLIKTTPMNQREFNKGVGMVEKTIGKFFKLSKPEDSDMAIGITILMDRGGLYEYDWEEYTIEIQITSQGTTLHKTRNSFREKNWKRCPVTEGTDAFSTASDILKALFKSVDYSMILGIRELGKVVAVRGKVVTVDCHLTEGMRVNIFRPAPKTLDFNSGNLIQPKDILTAEGVVITSGRSTSEIQIDSQFAKILETYSVKSGR